MPARYTYIILATCFCTLIFSSVSCTNATDWNNVGHLQNDSIYPEKATIVTITVTDSGYKVAVINSPLMERFSGKKPYLEMKKGLQGFFYDKQGVKQNQLDANYAISYENEKIMEVRNDVRLENVKGEKLKTEKLTWNQATKKIYTDQFVTITTPDQVIYGDGFESNQNFTQWRILHPHGILSVKNSKTDSAQVDSVN